MTTNGSNFNYLSELKTQALSGTIRQHFMPIEYKSHIELFRNWSVHESYCLKALITSEQVITSVVEKKNNLYQQNFEVYTGKPGSRIGDWELGIGDRGSLIPEKGRKIRILLLLYKKFDPNNQFHSFWWVFVLLQLQVFSQEWNNRLVAGVENCYCSEEYHKGKQTRMWVLHYTLPDSYSS